LGSGVTEQWVIGGVRESEQWAIGGFGSQSSGLLVGSGVRPVGYWWVRVMAAKRPPVIPNIAGTSSSLPSLQRMLGQHNKLHAALCLIL